MQGLAKVADKNSKRILFAVRGHLCFYCNTDSPINLPFFLFSYKKMRGSAPLIFKLGFTTDLIFLF